MADIRLIDARVAQKIADKELTVSDAGTVQFVLSHTPTIDPESLRPVGEWKLHEDGSGTCSQCNFTQKNVWDDDNWQQFCGVCGARMVVK